MLIYIQREMRFGSYNNATTFHHFVADLNRNQVDFRFNIWHFIFIITINYLLLWRTWIFSTSSMLNLLPANWNTQIAAMCVFFTSRLLNVCCHQISED